MMTMPISVCNTPLSGRNPAVGFTLLELLLVLTIIGLTSVLVVPNMGSLDARTFSAQVRQANSLLNYARRTAVVSGQPTSATFVTRQDLADENDLDELQIARSSVGTWLSDGTQLSFVDSARREQDIDEFLEVSFYPEGGSTGGTLTFSQGEQQQQIHIDPFTGRIETGSDEQL
jgi:general secretion pathway protein H